MKEIKEDLNAYRDTPHLWFGKFNTVEMSILPKFIYRFHIILINISTKFIFPK